MTERVLAVGQYLGTQNRIRAMRYFKTWGWVATDSTGVEYAQRLPRGADPYRRSIFPDGLRSTDRIEPVVENRPLTPWPPAPGQEERHAD